MWIYLWPRSWIESLFILKLMKVWKFCLGDRRQNVRETILSHIIHHFILFVYIQDPVK